MRPAHVVGAALLVGMAGMGARAAAQHSPSSGPFEPQKISPPNAVAPAPRNFVTLKPIKGQILQQPAGTILWTALEGAAVRAGANDKIASVSDLILARDGSVQGVVVVAGGFLGLGAHSIALRWNTVKIEMQEGNPILVISATQPDLEHAPPLKTLAEMKKEVDAEQLRGQRPAPDAGPAQIQRGKQP